MTIEWPLNDYWMTIEWLPNDAERSEANDYWMTIEWLPNDAERSEANDYWMTIEYSLNKERNMLKCYPIEKSVVTNFELRYYQ